MSWREVVVVTGAANGIGEGIARRYAADGAVVYLADRDVERAQVIAREIGAKALQCDVAVEENVKRLVETVVKEAGRVDFFVSNAGIHLGGVGADGMDRHTPAQWDRIWRVNVLSHVLCFQALLPHFRRQKKGRFLVTASAAGLLSQIGDASYSATKHAAVGIAEAIAIAHGDEGVIVHCLAPQAVLTNMNAGAGKDNPALVDGVLTVEQVAQEVVDATKSGKFLILPHPKVGTYVARKAQDYDKWLLGMRKWRRSML
jgi:NAD(P)-dependent dehydrogenase (short-subunit alcohol dehydrogenase family)